MLVMSQISFPFLILGGLIAATPSLAQDRCAYPSQTIRIIVSVPAGGGVDSVTRVVAEKDAAAVQPSR